MGNFHGSVRHLGRSLQQLRANTGRESGDTGGRLCPGLPSPARTIDLCHHSAAGEDPKRARLVQARAESCVGFSPMKCPFCGFANDKVVDSRESKEADSIRRRRECLRCSKRFTTYERIDEIPYMVVKKDGGREKFDRQKVLNGLLRACEKRPVPIGKLEQIVNEAES